MTNFCMHACCLRKTLKEYSKRYWNWHNKTGILGLKSVSIAKALRGFVSEPIGAAQNVLPDPLASKNCILWILSETFFGYFCGSKNMLIFIPDVCIIVVARGVTSASWFWIWFHYLDCIFLDPFIYPNPSFLSSISIADY